jgi:GGDEF domain-containing protein
MVDDTTTKRDSVPSSDKLSGGRFKRYEVSDSEMKNILGVVEKKAGECMNNECRSLNEAVKKANETTKIKLFLDALTEIGDKMKDIKPIADDLAGKVAKLFNNDNNDNNKKSIQKLVDKAMIMFAKLDIGYQAEKKETSFNLHNVKYIKTSLARLMADEFIAEKFTNLKSLNSLGFIIIDLDGLKVVNELSLGKYASGDKALQIVADVLNDDKFKKWARNLGVNLVPGHYHGDEFLLILDGLEKGVDLIDREESFVGVNGKEVKGISIIKYIGEYIGVVVKNTEENKVREIFDFSNEEQRKKVTDFRQVLSEEERRFFDDNFIYELNCSFGYSTMRDAVAKVADKEIINNLNEKSFGELILEIMRKGMIATAAEKLGSAKGVGKIAREQGNIKSRIIEKFYRFVRERRVDSISKEDATAIHNVLIEFRTEAEKLKEKIVKNKHTEAMTLNEMLDIIRMKGGNSKKKLAKIEKAITGKN